MRKQEPIHPSAISSATDKAKNALSDQLPLPHQAIAVLQRLQRSSGTSIGAQGILVLQRTVGNTAVQRLLAPPPTAGTLVIQRGSKDEDTPKKKRKKPQKNSTKTKKGKISKKELNKISSVNLSSEEEEQDIKSNEESEALGYSEGKEDKDDESTESQEIQPPERLIRTYRRNKEQKATPKKNRYLFKSQQNYNYEELEKGKSTQIDVGIIKGKFHKGFGNQPFLSVNRNDYQSSAVASDYDSLTTAIKGDTTNEDKNTKEQLIAKDILTFIENGDEKIIEKYPPKTKLAISTLVQLTQYIEPHPSRLPGSDKLARASLRRISKGESTFKAEFNRKDGNFVPARVKKKSKNAKQGGNFGGQEAGRALFGVPKKKNDKAELQNILTPNVQATIDEMSDSSAELDAPLLQNNTKQMPELDDLNSFELEGNESDVQENSEIMWDPESKKYFNPKTDPLRALESMDDSEEEDEEEFTEPIGQNEVQSDVIDSEDTIRFTQPRVQNDSKSSTDDSDNEDGDDWQRMVNLSNKIKKNKKN